MSDIIKAFNEAATALVQENTTLQTKVEELESELVAWKAGQKQAISEAKALQTELEAQRRTLGSYDGQKLVFVLLDGDGTLFLPSYLSRGKEGGRDAAMRLREYLNEYIAQVLPGQAVEIVVQIYMNKAGLSYIFEKEKQTDYKNFERFVIGFNQSTPLWSIIDTGAGRESVDSKLRDSVKLFASLPQTKLVLFSGAHDAGYSTTLSALENKGLASKIHLLITFTKIPQEIKSLNLQSTSFPDLFQSQKILLNGNMPVHRAGAFGPFTPTGPKALTMAPSLSSESLPTNGIASSVIAPAPLFAVPPTGPFASPRIVSEVKQESAKAEQAESIHKSPTKTSKWPENKYRTVPCANYHLSTCKFGDKCNFSHDPIDAKEKAEIAKKWSGKLGVAPSSPTKPVAEETEEVFLYAPNNASVQAEEKFQPLISALQTMANTTRTPLRSKVGERPEIRAAIKQYSFSNFKAYSQAASDAKIIQLLPATSKGPGSEAMRLITNRKGKIKGGKQKKEERVGEKAEEVKVEETKEDEQKRPISAASEESVATQQDNDEWESEEESEDETH